MNDVYKIKISNSVYDNYIKSYRIDSNISIILFLMELSKNILAAKKLDNDNDFYNSTDDHESQKFIYIRTDLKRAFIEKNEDDLISFTFPFTLKYKQKNNRFKLQYKNLSIDLIRIEIIDNFLKNFDQLIKTYDNNSDRIDLINSIFEELFHREDSIFNYEYRGVEEDRKETYIANTKNIIFDLLSFDYGYLRYDLDEANENGNIHPLKHLDIFTNDDISMKIGISNNYDIDKFIDLFNKKTACHFFSN